MCGLEWLRGVQSVLLYISTHATHILSSFLSAVLKNISPGTLKTIIFAAFSLNLTLTYIIMLVPPREYLEGIVVRSNRYDGAGKKLWDCVSVKEGHTRV